ncbi:hypothetical protein ACOMHN_005090 [Nucella lapillus]
MSFKWTIHPHCVFSLVVLFSLLLASSLAAPRASPPNIVFIMADDLGFNDVSWNNPNVTTPHLGNMANNGVILTQSYSQSACTPSRAAYLTGYYPFRIGVQNSVVREGMEDYVPLDVDFLPKRLKEAGYSTHLVGKWHLGHCRRDATPPAKGFDTFLGLLNGYNDYYTKKIRVDPNAPGTIYDFFSNYTLQPSSNDEYTTDIFTDRAIELIETFKDSPFFIALHYTAPHWPLQMHPGFTGSEYPDVTDTKRKIYLSSITYMDEGIGKVLEALEEADVMDNTLIIFQSDNGGDTHFSASNEPLRERKTTLYEGGVRVPSIAYGPGLLQNTPRVKDDLFHIVDWFSTLLSAAGVDSGNVDGVNQWNMLRTGAKGPRKSFIYNIHGHNAAIRVGQYKLIEGNAHAFQARRKRSADAMDMDQDLAIPLSRHRRATSSGERRPNESDKEKIKKALNDLPQMESLKMRGKASVNGILKALARVDAKDVTVTFDCHQCELYDIKKDPSEKTDIVKDYPAIVLFMHNLLTLYKAEEVEPVLAYPFHKDSRFQELNYTDNTWCFNDVSWHNKEVKTPNLQNMADNGVILNQAYSKAACTP